MSAPWQRALLLAIALAAAPGLGWASAPSGPQPPCAEPAAATVPPPGEPHGPPQVRVWNHRTLDLPASCPGAMSGRFDLVVALSGRFDGPASVEAMAARIGAVSALRGLVYWSVTDRRWRTLIDDAFALRQPSRAARRPDFSAVEVLAGEALYLAQADSRSSGYGVHALRTIRRSASGVVLEARNVTPIRLYLLTLFEAEGLRAYHFLRHEGGRRWRYYGLSLARSPDAPRHWRSFVNRAAAYYRFLAGRRGDSGPPLAP